MRKTLAVIMLLTTACGSSKDGEAPVPNAPADTPVVPPAPVALDVPEFGTDATRQFKVVGTSAQGLATPRALAFHPDRHNELWVVNRTFDGTVTFFDPGTPQQRTDKRKDAYANHFMEEVSSIAFGARNTFGTCQESNNTYDNAAPPNGFMGPSLWSADMAIYARVHQGTDDLLGSHLDMLHQSPFCMGIAHDHDNAYWVFDGQNGHVVYYDFQHDHGPGGDDHSDGIIRRYPEAAVKRVPGIPGHMVIDPSEHWLYVADTGGARIIRLDTRSGRKDAALRATNEALAEYSRYTGARVETFASQNLHQPSGLAIHNGRLFVADYGTQEIIAYSLDRAKELGRLKVTAQGLMGITFGPEGDLWYVDGVGNTVVHVIP